jgi:hypothetical protein
MPQGGAERQDNMPRDETHHILTQDPQQQHDACDEAFLDELCREFEEDALTDTDMGCEWQEVLPPQGYEPLPFADALAEMLVEPMTRVLADERFYAEMDE